MPKSNFRYKHMDRKGGNSSSADALQSSLTRSDLRLSTPPRKVSFEDNRNDSYVSIRSDDTVPTNNNKITEAGETNENEQERRSIRRKRSLLVRPATSLSLVDLAKSGAQDGTSPVICEQNSGDEIEGRNSKRVRSFNVSPRSVVNASDLTDVNKDVSSSVQLSAEGESKLIRTSPWGHFIDMAPEEDDYFDLPRTPYPNYNCMMKTTRRGVGLRSCRDSLCRSRRRPSPYGEYKSFEVRVEHPTLNFVGLRTDIKSTRKFRLSPRKIDRTYRSADELIGVFSELQVRHVDQKKI